MKQQVRITDKRYGTKYIGEVGVVTREHTYFYEVEMADGTYLNPNKPTSNRPQCEYVTEQQPLPIFN